MRSLLVKLIGAFIVVILIGGVINAWLVNRATRDQFGQYVTQSGQMMLTRLTPALADYYARTGSWQGVDAILEDPWSTSRVGQGHMGSGMGEMMRGFGGGQGDLWRRIGLRLLLADDRGVVVVDTQGSAEDTTLNPADLDAGLPIQVGEQHVGTLLAVSAVAEPTGAATDFLDAVQRASWLAGLVAALVALVLGLLLFRQIIAPVRRLTKAAEQVAAGQLDQRIQVNSRDELGQLAMAFNRMAESLDHQQQLRRSMIADVAHELRTPISVLQGNLEAMLDGVLPTSPQEIAALRDESALLARLVEDLRLLSLAEAGQLVLQRSRADLGALIERTVEPLRTQAYEHRIDLQVEVPTGLPAVMVDVDRIAQVLRNLVANALRHTPSGGIVSVGAELLLGDKGAREVLVSVIDSGEGIPPEDLPYIFERFYRADKSRSRLSGGSGIGLSIVKGLVSAHGGRVWVESQPGQGAKFYFTLPVD